jgi:hypothetical protein
MSDEQDPLASVRKIRASREGWFYDDGPVIDLRDDDNVTVQSAKNSTHNIMLPEGWADEIYPPRHVSETPCLDPKLPDDLFGETVTTKSIFVPQKPSRRTIASILGFRRRAKADIDDLSDYSIGVRINKRIGDAQNWLGRQLDLKGEHATRNKIILGLGVVAVGFAMYKGFSGGGGNSIESSDLANQATEAGSKTPSQPSGTASTTIIENLNSAPTLPETTPEIPANIPVQPEIISQNVTQITIDAPGEGMWRALSQKGYDDNQIWRMLHTYADQNGVTYESLNYVEVGQTFDIPLA